MLHKVPDVGIYKYSLGNNSPFQHDTKCSSIKINELKITGDYDKCIYIYGNKWYETFDNIKHAMLQLYEVEYLYIKNPRNVVIQYDCSSIDEKVYNKYNKFNIKKNVQQVCDILLIPYNPEFEQIIQTECYNKLGLTPPTIMPIIDNLFKVHPGNNKKKINLGILGAKHHGKSTSADYLAKDSSYIKISFGKILKSIVYILFGINIPLNKEIPKKSLNGRCYRDILITVGDMIRTYKIFNWFNSNKKYKPITNTVYNIISFWKDSQISIIVDDVRFDDEIEMLESLNFDIVKIVRDGYNGYIKYNHESEQDKYSDDSIVNNSTLDNLYTKLDEYKNKIEQSIEIKTGRLELITGCMYSGKSNELQRRLQLYSVPKKNKVLFANRSIYASIYQLIYSQDFADNNIICLDEGHLFDNISMLITIVNNFSKIIIVSALDSDQRQIPYYEIMKLIPFADSVIKFKAICMFCEKHNAIFSIKHNNKFKSCCKRCYIINNDSSVD